MEKSKVLRTPGADPCLLASGRAARHAVTAQRGSRQPRPRRTVIWRIVRAVARTLAVAALQLAAQVADAQTLTPLYGWWSGRRGDNFTTSDTAWVGAPGDRSRDGLYGFHRIEAQIFPPDLPQPPDTIPLFNWYSPSRGDNFLTSDPAWAGSPGDTRPPDYMLFRLEGYVFDRPFAGTVPLQSWYSASRGDNFFTAHPDWVGRGTGPRSGYTFTRIEGYAYPASDQPPDVAESFGYGSLTVNGRPAAGNRPLLVLLARHLGTPGFTSGHTRAHYERLFFGGSGSTRNVAAYFRENSYGAFTPTRGAVLGPYDLDEARSGNNCVGCLLQSAIARDGLRLDTYDTDRNGTVTSDELLVVQINSDTDAADGATTYRNQVTPAGSTVSLDASVTFAGQGASFATLAHEISHQLGTEDVYGSRGHGDHLTLLGPTIFGRPDVMSTFHIDPFHKMRLGWIRPRVIAASTRGASAILDAVQIGGGSAHPNKRPLLLYDPAHGRSEFFLVEFRSPTTATGGGYDAEVAGQGLVVWYVRINADKSLRVVAKVYPGRDGRFQTPVRGDDVLADLSFPADGLAEEIRPGADLVLDSARSCVQEQVDANGMLVSQGDQCDQQDALMLAVGGPYQEAGGGGVVPPGGSIVPSWLDRSPSPFAIDAGPLTPAPANIAVDWNFGRRQRLRLDRLAATSVPRGGLLAIDGMFPLAQGRRAVGLIAPSGRFIELPVASWTTTRLTARVPVDLAPGSYRVRAYSTRVRGGMTTRSAASNTLLLEIRA